MSRVSVQALARSQMREDISARYNEKLFERRVSNMLTHWRSKVARIRDVTPPQVDDGQQQRLTYLNTPSARERILLATPGANISGTPRTTVRPVLPRDSQQTPARRLTSAFRSVAHTAPGLSERDMPFRKPRMAGIRLEGDSDRRFEEVEFEDIQHLDEVGDEDFQGEDVDKIIVDDEGADGDAGGITA
jgi:hypothetical protein